MDRYIVPHCRTDTYRHLFFHSAIRLWDQLPAALTIPDSVEGFKSNLGE